MAEKPFDFIATPGKLPKQVRPTEYAVRIVPNIEARTFEGSETVKFEARTAVRELVLNAADLKITGVTVDEGPIAPAAIKLDSNTELLRIALSVALPAGPHRLSVKFSGTINEQGQGLYYMRYQEENTGAKKIALATQFEPTDARRFFPCWDEPSFRARFQLTVVVPEAWMAVSNMPVESEIKADGGKEVRFKQTPPMASYLNVFVAGELETIETDAAGTRIRVVTTKGKAKWGQYALESTAQILQYYNDYFGVPYPLPKLDQIAIPGGFGGAMENWGGITYFESALLYNPDRSSAATKQVIYEVIAHEVAHMWFGDLVTMAWWDNLWLNEGFASWMGSKCSAHFNPDWEVRLAKVNPRDPTRRTGISREIEMEGDARSTTHPIQQTVSTESEANSAFDDVTYRKGEAFLVMLENFLGEEKFRNGIRSYMADHKYSNSTTADLWKALSTSSSQPVGDIAAAWTEQPGLPIVRVKRNGDTVDLSQERFVVHFPNAPALQWKIPLTYFLVDGGKTESRLMSRKTDKLEQIPTDRVLKLNAQGTGNYRVQYDRASWDLLMAALPQLSVADRVNLAGDVWAMLHAGRLSLKSYFALVNKLPPKPELAERNQIVNVFDSIDRLLIGDPTRDDFQGYARSILRPTFEQLGWTPRPDEGPRPAILRASLIQILGQLDDADVVNGCRSRFQKHVVDPAALPGDLRAPVCWVAGHYADESTWNTLHELGLRTTSTEEKQDYYDAMAAARDPQLVEKTLQIALTDELPTSRALYLVAKVARYSDHPELAWQFAKTNSKALLAKADSLGSNSYFPSLSTFFSEKSRAADLKAFSKTNLPPTSAKEVQKAVDEIEFRAEFRKRLSDQISTGALP